MELPVLLVVALAFVFAFSLGFHDACGATATSVSTRALTPRAAVVMAAGLNLVGALIGDALARELGTGLVVPPQGGAGLLLMTVALVTAIGWNVGTWLLGIPSSSTHALFGAMVGSALPWAATVSWSAVVQSVLVPLILTPVVGFTLAYLWTRTLIRGLEKLALRRANARFQQAQVLSAAAYAVGHGLQSGQKVIAVVIFVLIAAREMSPDAPIPWWVRAGVALAVAVGTFFGGWRIVRTVGRRLADLDPVRGFGAESGATVIMMASTFGLSWPVSTSHSITSAVAGSAATNGLRHIRARVSAPIVACWLLTFPGTFTIAAVLSLLVVQVAR